MYSLMELKNIILNNYFEIIISLLIFGSNKNIIKNMTIVISVIVQIV